MVTGRVGLVTRAADASNRLMDSMTQWLDERLGLDALHYEVPRHSNSIFYSLGGLTLVAFVTLAVTGVYLLQFTTSDPESARDSIVYLITRVDYGNFVRSVHFWAANLMVVTMMLHMLRIFVTGSYKRPREGQWLIGVLMLVIISLTYFAGTVIKWDQEAYEAFLHFQEMMTGIMGSTANIFSTEQWGTTTVLARVYRMHTIILPAAFVLLLIPHLLLIKRQHLSPITRRDQTEDPPQDDTVQTTFLMHQRHLIGYGMLFVAVIALLAVAFPAQIGGQVILGLEVTLPPWFFWWEHALANWWGLWAFQWATILIIVGLLVLPFVDRYKGRHPLDRPLIALLGVIVLGLIVYLTFFVLTSPTHQHVGL